MSPRLKALLDEVRELSVSEQKELMEQISLFLKSKEKPSSDFWQLKSLTQLTQESITLPVNSLKDLKNDFWPQEESIEEILAFYAERRKEATT